MTSHHRGASHTFLQRCCEPTCEVVPVQAGSAQGRAPVQAALLYERVLAAALSWFSGPVAYFGGWSPAEARCGTATPI